MNREEWKQSRWNGADTYKGHRIHPFRLQSGTWVISLVKLGAIRNSSAGPPVENVDGRFPTEQEAVRAAKALLDHREVRESEHLAGRADFEAARESVAVGVAGAAPELPFKN